MAKPAPLHVLVEQLAGDMHALAFDLAEPSRTIARADRLTAEGERIAAALHEAGDRVRRMFRGG